MTDWNAALYRKFERERTRAAVDLLAAVPLTAPRHVVDLGCGPGNSTKLLVERYPHAQVVGLDTSPDMLASARASVAGATFAQADVATWEPQTAPDLIFANAVLQWLPDHARLLPRLLSQLSPGGVLAVQMPDNLDEPSHALMRASAAQMPFAAKLAGAAAAREPLAAFERLYEWLRPTAARVDLWRTTYVHVLDGAPAIVEWVKATGLRPFVDPLDEVERRAFLTTYERALAAAYPPQSDGMVLLRFPRQFMVAVKA